MLKILLVALLVGLVSSCAMEDPDTSGVLVDPNSDTEVPDWLTASYLDLNKDGTIDILDLVIHSKFFGQEVTETDVLSSETGETAPCENINARFPKLKTVTDNTDYRQIFNIGGEKYVYALLAVSKIFAWTNWEEYMSLSKEEKSNYMKTLQEQQEHELPSCLAVRFLLNKELLPISIKIKTVAGYKHPPIADPFTLALTIGDTDSGCRMGYCKIIGIASGTEASDDEPPKANLGVLKDFDYSTFKIPEDREGYWAKIAERKKTLSIPIDDNHVISGMRLVLYDHPNKYMGNISYNYSIQHGSARDPFANETYNDQGVYIKMLPAEVRRRYFPEDIE